MEEVMKDIHGRGHGRGRSALTTARLPRKRSRHLFHERGHGGRSYGRGAVVVMVEVKAERPLPHGRGHGRGRSALTSWTEFNAE